MPVIKSAKKKLKVDRKRESANKRVEALINLTIKKAQKQPTQKNTQEAFKLIDKGVKNRIYHKNKAARMKSRLSKLLNNKLGATIKSKTPKSSGVKEIKKNKK
jgi:small subunit ribosomal protein S20